MEINCVWNVQPAIPHGRRRKFTPDDPMGFWQSTQDEANVKEKEAWIVLPLEEEEPNDVNCFIDCIEQGRESEMNARAAAHLTHVLLAGYKSAATGKVESVPDY